MRCIITQNSTVLSCQYYSLHSLMASLITLLQCKDHAETEVLAWVTDTPFCNSSKYLLISCVQKSKFGE